MDNQRLIRKGLAQEKLEELKALILRIDNSCKSITQALFLYDGVENLETAAAAAELTELLKSIARYKVLKREIKELDDSIIIPSSPAEC